MSNSAIPKEQMTAFQRWEMASFDDDRKEPAAITESRKRLEQEMSRDREIAKKSGYEDGLAKGKTEGYNQGKALVVEHAQRLSAIASTFEDSLKNVDVEVAKSTLLLSAAIARTILKKNLEISEDAVLPIVHQAIKELGELVKPTITVNPQDAAILRAHASEMLNSGPWRIVEEESVQPGGCIIETASNQINATIPNRWQQLMESLGVDLDWLDKR